MNISGVEVRMSTTNVLDWFYAPTRLVSDKWEEEAKTFANTTAVTRQTLNLTAGCSDTLNPAAAMADQPGMIAMGGYGQPGTGCKVDENTDLRWGIPGAWRQKGQKQLWARPFATTPYLGGGEPQAVDDESNLIFSAMIRNRKEAGTIMDKAIPNFYQPLITLKKSEYSKPTNWVEDWTRGGDATRLVQTKRVAV
jgi:hypothetical protein